MASLNLTPELPLLLLPWYREHKRELPWREDREPYHIWLSEVMLQQTRVEAVRGYYARFLAALPDIASLAACDDDALTKLWEGLGYYSRVRNLKKAAQVIMAQHSGVFPQVYSEVLALPGIGEYTAGAVCSIAFNQPVPAVDGNVLRVVSRLTDDHSPIDDPKVKSRVRQMLLDIYPEEAGEFTQALMELGATVCGPNRKPDCGSCPCQSVCEASKLGSAETLPVKLPKKQRQLADMTVFILSCDGCFALEKRQSTGLLAGLWQFPNIPGHWEPELALAKLDAMGIRPKELQRRIHRTHIFTHIQWNMEGYYLEVQDRSSNFCWFTPGEINRQTAMPTAFRQFWEETGYV